MRYISVWMGVLLFLWIPLHSLPAARAEDGAKAALSPAAQAGVSGERPDIQWFKREMHISPKYREVRNGVLGMSWLHFITMVFLVVFFIGSVTAVYFRNKRTKEILLRLVEEETNGH